MKAWAKGFTLIAVFLMSITTQGPVYAEKEFYDFTIDGDLELGWLFFLERPSEKERGKFEEYRDMRPGIYGNLDLLLMDKNQDYLFEVLARNTGREDQNYLFRTSKSGLYTFEFEWDQIPHIFSTTSPLKDEIEVRWDTARFGFDITPTPEVDIMAEYRHTYKHGEYPRGAASEPFEGPPNPFDYEALLQPVKYTDHDVNLVSAWAKKAFQLQLSYNLSLFENDVKSMIADVDDPANTLNRVALYPDNVAHTFTAAGGVNLPSRTRVNGAFSYGLHLQNEDFLPPVDAGLSQLPNSNLDGQVDTMLFYLSGTSRPIDQLVVKAMYRLYRYDDETDEFLVPLTSDVSILAQRFPFTKQDAGLDLKGQTPWPVALNVGYHWQRWDRDGDVLEVSTSDEHTPKVSLDITPMEWLLLSASYAHAIRVISDYHTNPEGLPPGHPPVTGLCNSCHTSPVGPGNPLFQKFDMASRNRDVVGFLAEVTPIQSLTVSANYSLANDDYEDSVYGVQDDRNWAAGADLTWSPTKRFSLNASYLHEAFKTRQRTNDFVINIDPGPLLETSDQADTVGAGMNVVLVPDKLDLDVKWSLSFASSDFHSDVLPNLDDTLNMTKSYLRYHFRKHWTAKLGYIFETFDITDAYTANPDPERGEESFYRDYTAHMIVLGLVYGF